MVVAMTAIIAGPMMLIGIMKIIMGLDVNVSTKRWYVLMVASAIALATTLLLSWAPWPWGLTTH